jgi:general secretion pathway protein J
MRGAIGIIEIPPPTGEVAAKPTEGPRPKGAVVPRSLHSRPSVNLRLPPPPVGEELSFTPPMRSAKQGFTLVELLVSLFIFGLLAAAGVSLLAFSVRAQASAKLRLADVAATERMGALLTADLLQAVPRISRNTRGDAEPAFRGGEGALLLSYVRSGAGGGDRSALQRVELRLEQGRIERVARAHVDGALALSPMILAENVARVELRFREKGEWQDRWASTKAEALPQAIELRVTRKGEAPVTRLFLVGVGS